MNEKFKGLVFVITIGLIMIGISFLIPSDYYVTLLFSFGFGLATSASIQIARLIYWNNPKRQDIYEAKLKETRINLGDERKQLLRMKSGHITYQIMTWLLLILSIVMALLHLDAWLIALFFLLFIINWVIGVFVYRVLEKRL